MEAGGVGVDWHTILEVGPAKPVCPHDRVPDCNGRRHPRYAESLSQAPELALEVCNFRHLDLE